MIRGEDPSERVDVVLCREPAEGVLELETDTLVDVERHADGRTPACREPLTQITANERWTAAEMEMDVFVLSVCCPRNEREKGGAQEERFHDPHACHSCQRKELAPRT